MQRFLSPRNDFAFKRLFGTEKNKEILIRFLNDVFEGKQDKIADVEFLKLSQDPEVASLRQSIVDVMCKDSCGKRWIIEMQCASDANFIKRAVAYASRAYLNQRTTESKRDENGYGAMKSVIFFAILNHTLFPQKKDYLSHHAFSDICSGERDIKELSFSFIELSKFKKKSATDLETNIEKWAYFFKHADSLSPTELESLEKSDKPFWKAYTALAEYNFTPEELLEYERYEMKQDEINMLIADAKTQGKTIGKKEGKRESALSMLADGLPAVVISKYTGLSESEILELTKT
ncbi:MAG: Rpn family recombination-promoting nuclease/putative transposase [Holosporaceae bacterium]|jgi:predicted transposase/invertase (TIGR01784 family)|nr:Rpn family recombination-promoting nuclease/putative transposase [Holosporaceae bacterium]